MKRKIKYFLICILFVTEVTAQKEFAPLGSEWYYSKVEDWNPPDEGYVKFTTIKDTTINDKPTRIIERVYYNSNGETENWTDEYIHQSGDTVFYFRDGEFRILFNFSLEKGDTMQFYSDDFNPCGSVEKIGFVVIDSLYMQTINEIALKTFLCSPTENSPWEYYRIAEGIGHYSGFYPRFNNTCDIQDFIPEIGELRCYSDNELGFVNIWNNPCDTIIDYKVFIDDLKVDNYFTIYPNPSDQILQIKSNNADELIRAIEIYSMNGQIILKKYIQKINCTIDLSSILAGIYLIKIKSVSDKISIQKLIIL